MIIATKSVYNLIINLLMLSEKCELLLMVQKKRSVVHFCDHRCDVLMPRLRQLSIFYKPFWLLVPV